MSTYGSVPLESTSSTPSTGGASSKTKTYAIGAAVVLLVLALLSNKGEAPAPAPSVEPEVVTETETVEEVWPPVLVTGPGFLMNPTSTADAPDLGWTKVEGEPCHPILGEPYRKNGGERTIADPRTLYFTPDVDGTPGLLSGIQVDFYGYVEENLVGSYFGEETVGAEGQTYRSLSLSIRDYETIDVCDTSAPLAVTSMEKVTLAPDLVAKNIPLQETDPELTTGWKEGACILGMGFHWAQDVVGGPDLTYEAKNLVPLQPMYNSATGKLQAVFFLATDTKQVWREGCEVNHVDLTQPCTSDITNSWDRAPGLTEANDPTTTFMCSNFCGDCQFTGSPTGMYTTMHFMFEDTHAEDCGGDFNILGLKCRHDHDPIPVPMP